MLNLREVVAYDTGSELVVLGGNMRLKALKDLGIETADVKIIGTGTDPAILREFVIKDNVGFGHDDWEAIKSDWDINEVQDWGLEISVLQNNNSEITLEQDKSYVINLKYTEEDYIHVKAAIEADSRTPKPYSMQHFPYEWYLKNGYPPSNNLKVFGTFVCGGGVTMGYKLAGFQHLGGIELDHKIAETYKINHNPKYLFNMDIRDFNDLNTLPDELYNLDILEGSPPCTTFSSAGIRERNWGKQKKFSEGQKLQTLDDLVFIFCNTIAKLQPKVAILENVSGLIKGNAILYSKQILHKLDEAGYNSQIFQLNAATMEVPQSRTRVFFIARRKKLNLPPLKLNFNYPQIFFYHIFDESDTAETLTEHRKLLWLKRIPSDMKFSDIHKRLGNKKIEFTQYLCHKNKVLPCFTTVSNHHILYDIPRYLNKMEKLKAFSWPLDYNFSNSNYNFITGMSIPPVMYTHLATEIYKQYFKGD